MGEVEEINEGFKESRVTSDNIGFMNFIIF
jgi:hypothetical protein